MLNITIRGNPYSRMTVTDDRWKSFLSELKEKWLQGIPTHLSTPYYEMLPGTYTEMDL